MKFVTLCLMVLAPGLVFADVPQGSIGSYQHPAPQGTFTFVRAEYESVGGQGESYYYYEGRLWQRWQTDYPEAEENFLLRLTELTTLKVNPKPISLKLTDKALFDYPFLYMCDVGWQLLRDDDIKALRAYLQRGGFLWVDDFWGYAEWNSFEMNMREVFPDLEWRTIPKTHPILNIVFPLEACPQVPAKIFWMQWGRSYDFPGAHRMPSGDIEGVNQVNFRGLFDEKGRLMVVATHNSDIGDGWEREAEDEQFFQEFSVKSYAIGINIIVYALTH